MFSSITNKKTLYERDEEAYDDDYGENLDLIESSQRRSSNHNDLDDDDDHYTMEDYLREKDDPHTMHRQLLLDKSDYRRKQQQHDNNNNNNNNTVSSNRRGSRRHTYNDHSDEERRLPDDALINVFSFLPVNTVTSVSLVCRDWYALCELNVFWKPLFEKAVFEDSIPRFILNQDEPWFKRIQERFEFSERISMAVLTGAAAPVDPTLTEQLSKEDRQQLCDSVETLVYNKYYTGKSMRDLRNLSTPLYYKSCFFYLHGYKVVGTRKYNKEQARQMAATKWNDSCTQCGFNYLIYAVVPLSTILFTLFFLALLLKQTIGIPDYIKQFEKLSDEEKKKFNFNLYTDVMWFPVFIPFFSGLLLWYSILVQVNVKHVLRYMSNIRQNYKTVSYGVITLCYFTSVLMFTFLGTLSLMFPYDPKASKEGVKYLWLRKLSHNDFLLISPIIAGIVIVNFVWPLIQFCVYLWQNRSQCISRDCLRRNALQIFIYIGGFICLAFFIGLTISGYTESEEEKGKGGSRLSFWFQNLAFVPLYIIQIAIVGLFLVLFKRLWSTAPLAIRFKVRVMCIVLSALIISAVALIIAFQAMLALKGLNVYLTIPLMPLPTVACALFYSVLYMKKVLFG